MGIQGDPERSGLLTAAIPASNGLAFNFRILITPAFDLGLRGNVLATVPIISPSLCAASSRLGLKAALEGKEIRKQTCPCMPLV